MSFFAELKRRNVIRVGAAYLVVAWLLIQVSDIVFPRLGLPEWTVTLVIALLALGLPLALFFAWAFELTPDGLKKEKDVERAASITPQTGRKLDRLVTVLLVLALLVFSVDRFIMQPQRDSAVEAVRLTELEQAREAGRSEALAATDSDDRSIAVLAFDDMSPEGDQEYLSDGIAEELLNLLAKIPELRVISRSSAFSYKGKDTRLDQIATELNVAHILEGSVRKAGNRIRITTQLIEARSDTHLWSETYDRTLDDVFAIQDEIAAAVVDQLKIKLLGEAPHVEETDPEAYALYLQARHLGRLNSAEGWEESNSLYEQALTVDPDYVAAWTGLAANYSNQAILGLWPPDEGFAKAREAAEKALAIDPDDARAHAGLGWIAMTHDIDLAAAVLHYERALQLAPSNLDTLGNAASLLLSLGRLEQAIEVAEFVAARDPVSPVSHKNLGVCYLFADRWDEAIAAHETALRLSPGSIGEHYLIGTALLFKGEAEAALAAFAPEKDEEYRVKGQALALYALDRQEGHREKLQELIDRWGDQWPSEVAHVYAYIGETDQAFEWLDRAVQAEEFFDPNDPWLRSLVNDPRWLPLLESIGRSPEQLDAIEFEVKLPD